MGFEDLIALIADGDPVSAGVTNRPTLALDAKLRYLYSLIQASSTGTAIFGREVTIESGALVGMPVYFNDLTGRFERALAKIESAPVEGALVTAPSARPWGVVYSKANATLADVVFYGYVALDIREATGADDTAGVYYLSGMTPGGLSQQRPPVSVPVLRSDGNGNVLVMPQFVDLMERHTHYRFDLVCLPAGGSEQPAPGERHTITTPDPNTSGWLPADHAVFGDTAPAGAAFGYNLAAHLQLQAVWPPIPTSQARLEWNRALDKEVGATGVPLGPAGACILDRNGIWWMSDCYGDVPWPLEIGTSASLSLSLLECPRDLFMELSLYFTKLDFVSDKTVVTSLRSLSERLSVRCVDGSASATGDLVIDLDSVSVIQEDVPGYVVVKEIDNTTVKRGPVCEGIYAISSNITLTGPASTEVDGNTVFHGPVGIAAESDPTRELSVQLIRLDGVEEQFYLDITYLGFRAGQATQLRAKLDVPADLTIPTPQLSLRLLILGRASGVLPGLTVTARRLPRPSDGANVPVQLPDDGDEFSVTIDTTGTLTLDSQYIEATAEAFTVEPGDVVFFTIAREADDGYLAEVGLIQISGALGSGS